MGSKQYGPDSVVETSDSIYIVETKIVGDIDAEEVKEKARAATEYCKYATTFTSQNGGKPWKYLLIPHNQVMVNMRMDYFTNSRSD